MEVVQKAMGAEILLHQGPHENSCRPAVDVLFRSVAKVYGAKSLAVVLTGMGQDGKRGCEEIGARGGQILVQDEETSVVWGMPGSAVASGNTDDIVSLMDIPDAVSRIISAN